MSLINYTIRNRLRSVVVLARRLVYKNTSTKNKSTNLEEDIQPVKFSTSPASKYRAKMSIQHNPQERLWYEPYVILGSVGVFLIYFTILREENDIDEMLSVPLHERIEGLEELQLRRFLENTSYDNAETAKARQRLKEIEGEKSLGTESR